MNWIASSTIERLVVLKDVEIFRALPFEVLVVLSEACRVARHEAGSEICKEGEPSRGLHIVVEGKVQIYRDRPEGRVVLLEGARATLFGELATLDAGPHFASVRALERTTLLEMSRTDFREIAHHHPEVALEYGRLLSQRIRALDALLWQPNRAPSSREMAPAVRALLEGENPSGAARPPRGTSPPAGLDTNGGTPQ